MKKICIQSAQEDHILTNELNEIKDKIPKVPFLNTSKNLTKSENFDKITENINQLSTAYSEKESAKETYPKAFNITKCCQQLGKPINSRPKFRPDAEMKKALISVKKFIKRLFKSMNSEIIQRRYINCSISQIFVSMRHTLLNVIPEELLADDLVYYTVGILSIKKPSDLDCKQKIKREIFDFIETNKRFTNKKFKKTIQSNSLRILCRYMIPQVDESTAGILRQALDFD
ncbi:unnamed protein product [Moneuplotes crassus]|uniref:Uncharacterized protein n=1 Tax=Euplotes crassus TaxID=5936 RepID=A0AAD1XPS4_EUPCR|nr:unnamed protein product [Moneuplotes crassus]